MKHERRVKSHMGGFLQFVFNTHLSGRAVSSEVLKLYPRRAGLLKLVSVPK